MKLCPLLTKNMGKPTECQKESCALYVVRTRRDAMGTIVESHRICGLVR